MNDLLEGVKRLECNQRDFIFLSLIFRNRIHTQSLTHYTNIQAFKIQEYSFLFASVVGDYSSTTAVYVVVVHIRRRRRRSTNVDDLSSPIRYYIVYPCARVTVCVTKRRRQNGGDAWISTPASIRRRKVPLKTN